MRQESLLNFPKTYFFSICSLLPAAPSAINWRLAVTANISSIILESEIILSAINLNLFEKFFIMCLESCFVYWEESCDWFFFSGNTPGNGRLKTNTL